MLGSNRGLCLALGLALLGTSLLATPAGADSGSDDPGRPRPHGTEPLATSSVTADVKSRPDGVYIHISARESIPGNPGETSSSPSAYAPASAGPPPPSPDAPAPATQSWTDNAGFHQVTPAGQRTDLTPTDISSVSTDFWSNQFQAHPGQLPYALNINNQFQGIVWIPDVNSDNVHLAPPDAPPDSNITGNGSTDPYQVALDVLGHVPLPNIQLRMNPGLGLVAMPGWFWVGNFDGQPFGASRTVVIPPPILGQPPTVFTVTVRVWPTEYDWLFGDGGSLVTHSLGQAYPAQSDVQHTYEYSSLSFSSGFPVDLTVQFAAEFRVNGGGPQPLPGIRHTWATTYPVQQAQAILGAPRKP